MENHFAKFNLTN